MNGSADVAGLEREGRGEEFCAAETGDAAIAGDQIGGFGVEAEGFGGGIEFFAGFDALDEVVDLGLSQLFGFLEAKFGNDLVADFFEGTRDEPEGFA